MIIKRILTSLIVTVLFLIVMTISGLSETNEDAFTCFGDMKNNFHISYLSLIDSDTNSSTFYSQEATLINSIVKQSLIKLTNELGAKTIIINAKEQLLKDTENNKKQLIKILEDPDLLILEKTQAICTQLKIGSEIDTILMGEYREFDTHIEMYLYLIMFRCQTYFIEKIKIKRNEFFCQNTNGSIKICKTKKEKFEKIVLGLFLKAFFINKTLWNEVLSWTNGSSPMSTVKHENLYVSHLSFMNPTTSTSLFYTNTGKLINDAVIKGINLAQKNVPFIKHNAAGHILEDNDAQANTLVDITFDRTMNKGDKLHKIIEKLMTPADIDVIITGQYIDKGGNVDVRPFIIIKNERKIVTKAVLFKKAEFLCPDPIKKSNTVLCKDAQEEISRLVKELLEQL